MKQSKQILIMMVATLMMATSVWAGDVTITKMLNGTENENVGTVTSRVNETNGLCTLTVTPANGYYIDAITAEKTVSGDVAQGRRFLRGGAPGMDNFLEVSPTDATADPSGVTTWTFTMPEDENYDVEVVANFLQRTDISTATVTLATTSFDYDGEAKTPAVTSVQLGNDVIAAADYDITYGDNNHDNSDAGEVTVYVTGKNTYTGTATATFTINKAAINPTVSLEGWTYGAAPETISPVVTGNTGNGAVTYTYKAEGATEFTTDVPQNAGTHTIKATIAETANYQGGEATQTFTIAKANLQLGIEIEGWTYGDEPVVPEVTGNLGKGEVTITYQSKNGGVPTTTVPTNAGDYVISASVAETANYNTGNTMREFSIAKAAFSQVVIAEITAQTFTGDSIKPVVTVTFNGQPVDASEYMVVYEDNVSVGAATITLISNEINFSNGDAPVTTSFEIVAAQVVVSAEDQTEIYNGDAQEFTNYVAGDVEVIALYYASEEDREANENQMEVVVDAGTYYVQLISGDENYTFAPVNATFIIEPKMLTDDMLWTDGAGDEIYDGQTKTWAAGTYGLRDEINEDEVDLVENEDFTVSYNNNTNVGTATITITGQGNYQGTITSDFRILRQLNISFGENTWVSYYAEEDLELPEGLKAYIVTNVDNRTVDVVEISYIPQYQGVLLTLDEENPVIADAYLASAYEGTTQELDNNLLKGVATSTAVSTLSDDSYIYVLYNDEFVKTTKGNIPENRCYLEVAKNTGAHSRLFIFIDTDASGIDTVNISKADKNDNGWYDLSGRRLSEKPVKAGLYIHEGHKVVLK